MATHEHAREEEVATVAATQALSLDQEKQLREVENVMGRAGVRIIRDLMERTDALEQLLAKYVRKNGANGTTTPATNGATSVEKGRWMDFVRFGGKCAACAGEIPKGPAPTSVLYVRANANNKARIFHKSCAPKELVP
jgi:hypothetical protein